MSDWLEDCLGVVAGVSVGVFGDFCLDAYWMIDPDMTEVAVETNLPIRKVREQRYSLGGAANVIANVCALGVREARALALVGDDTFGALMRRLLAQSGVETSGVLTGHRDWQTLVYAKPHFSGAEGNRFDFGAFNVLGDGDRGALVRKLHEAAGFCDAIILNQQVPAGTSPPEMIEELNAMVAAHPDCVFVADSRHRAELYRGVVQKMNAHEAGRICGETWGLEEEVPEAASRGYAQRLFETNGRPVFITRGEHGILISDEGGLREVPAVRLDGPVDTVGAGDTVTAALAAVLGAGGDPVTAARLAALAAAVTIRKLYITGTATADEIRAAAREARI
jgi:rfaE bifunctional protein kinase chain/domain